MNINILKQIQTNLSSFSFLIQDTIPIIQRIEKEGFAILKDLERLLRTYSFIVNTNREKQSIVESNQVASTYHSFFDFSDVSPGIENLAMSLEKEQFIFRKVPPVDTFYDFEDTPDGPVGNVRAFLKLESGELKWKFEDNLLGFEFRTLLFSTATNSTITLEQNDLDNKFYLVNIGAEDADVLTVQIGTDCKLHSRFGFFVYDGAPHSVNPIEKRIRFLESMLPEVGDEVSMIYLDLYKSAIFRKIESHYLVESYAL